MSKINLSQLIAMLSDEAFTSGEDIASHFGVSRTAVAKQIKSLQEMGLDIYSVNRRGYKLQHPVSLLSKGAISAALTEPDAGHLDIHLVLDSTNDYVKENIAGLPDGYTCLAEAQRKGKGRQGKAWFSPLGSNVYLSMKWGFINGFQSLSGLSLAIGVALLRVIKRYVSSEVSLKWPNDVYIQGEKVAGILIEVSGNPDGSCDAIVGVGLNLNMPEADSITQPWTDLASHLNKPMDKNRVVADLINELRQTLREFCVAGLSQFVADWEAHDHFRDSDIKLLIGQREINGIARGISDTGALLVDVNDDGKISRQSFFGGEISVRQA